MQNKLNILATCAFLVSCTTVTKTEYIKQTIPDELLVCEEMPHCNATMQSDVAQCLIERATAYESCKQRIEQIKELQR